MNELWPWLTLVLLGAYHGINPAMGWLFAVALGLQERSRMAVLQALVPIAIGHAVSIVLAVTIIGLAQVLIPPDVVRLACGGVLIGFGVYRLVRQTHPRWVGMRVGFRDLIAWSLLMSTAHGAGLMLTPVLFQVRASGHTVLGVCSLGVRVAEAAQTVPTASRAAVSTAALWVDTGLAVVSMHTVGMFVVMGVVAVVVFEKVGLAILRRAWFNLDLVWAAALVCTGVLTLSIF
jgi:hypothetical protein